jgi:hypothetical protein
MFESIVSKVTQLIRNTVRAIDDATRRTPWLLPLALVALVLVW